eukprot:scaffold13438_cov75-Phaeocystis_antarctica.AAC.3
MSRTDLRARAVVYRKEPRQAPKTQRLAPPCSFPNHRAFAELCHSSPAAHHLDLAPAPNPLTPTLQSRATPPKPPPLE